MSEKKWVKLYCKQCDTKLTFGNIYPIKDLDFSEVGTYCRDCGETIEEQLKEDRFIEEYKGNKIYYKDRKFSPYWQSHYYFESIEDVKARIDNNEVGVYPGGLLK